MKKVIGLIMVAFLMVACAQQKPVDTRPYQDAVVETLDALKAGDLDKASTLLKGNAKKNLKQLMGSFQSSMNQLPEGVDQEKAKKLVDDIAATMFNSIYQEYEVKKVTIGDKVATVKVRVKGVDSKEMGKSDLLQEVQTKVLEKASTLDVASLSQDEIIEKVFGFFPEALQEYLSNIEPKTQNLVVKVERESKKVIDF